MIIVLTVFAALLIVFAVSGTRERKARKLEQRLQDDIAYAMRERFKMDSDMLAAMRAMTQEAVSHQCAKK